MTDDTKDLDQKYRKDGKFKKQDSDRLSLKAVKQALGEEQHTDYTGRAMSYVVSGFQEQEKQHLSEIGSAEKKLHGFWLAATALVKENPDIKPKQAWDMLPEFDHDHWQFILDGDEMIQRYHGRDKKLKKSQDHVSIKFDAFRQTYVYEAKKELSNSDK